MGKKHMDEARHDAATAMRAIVEREHAIERAVLIDDLFGRLRVVVWAREGNAGAIRGQIEETLRKVAEPYWSGEIWIASGAPESEEKIYEKAWEEGKAFEGSDRFRLTSRHRSHETWMQMPTEPPWKAPGGEAAGGPPIVVFYSFKGGMGRSTALASFAIRRAREGERVVVLDFDLDAPGLGTLLASDEVGTTAPWGVVDYLLEGPFGEVDLQDYYHACRREKVTGPGEILVVPAGRLNSDYLGKLSRIDFELPSQKEKHHILLTLFREIREKLNPKWLLLDARAGLSEPAGLLLGGHAHLHALFGTSSEQSWRGLRLVLHRLGAERVFENLPQLDCLLVQAMVPEDSRASAIARGTFSDRARDEFADHYYAPDPEDPEEDRFWYVRDLEDEDAPHAPVAISYQPKLAHFEKLDDVADALADSPDYRGFANRIVARFQESGD